jgi:hypothetical protein
MSEASWWIKNVSAVLITRGDVPVSPVVYSLPFEDVVVWDTSLRGPQVRAALMYARYMAVASCKHDIIYVQDDDCIVDARSLVQQYQMGTVTCNMPVEKREEYNRIAPGISLVGWGAVFHRARLKAFDSYIEKFPADDLFYREADRVFTYLNSIVEVDVPFRHLPHAYNKNRMGAQPEHLSSLAKIQERLCQL